MNMNISLVCCFPFPSKIKIQKEVDFVQLILLRIKTIKMYGNSAVANYSQM